MRYMKIILNKGKFLNPCFPKCGMFFPWKALNGRNPSTAMCTRVKEIKKKISRRRRYEIRDGNGSDTIIQTPPIHIIILKYLGRVLTVADAD